MRLILDDEQQQLSATVHKVLADHAPATRVREVMTSDVGEDTDLWRRLSSELGVAGLVVPERFGGSGAGHVERCVVAEELGAALTPVPFFASAVLAVDTLLGLGDDEACAEFLPTVVSGESVAAVAMATADGMWGAKPLPVQAESTGDGWQLTGTAPYVLSGMLADVLLVYARTPDGTGVFAVRPDASGMTRVAARTLDPTRRIARLDFAAAPARRLGTGDAGELRRSVGELAAIALAAEQVGGMRRVLDMTVDYAKVRVQFGRAIGSYQAVKHTCADMYSDTEQAISALRYAAWAADHDRDALPGAAALAQLYIGPSYFRAAANAVQLHGGIGYTWEHDAHLYYKRAKSSELLFGGARQARERLAGLLDLPGGS
ncbi:alkylation response protein AidB-like acyl-CoA dehydrogenase [Tamaricihabitans halophyticus]|uniref:Alkylation response protein AidB-like acyl-CoA dehydrogenase n=1 Tax=Tamaricihabitans halophyticus TaxID=1262583 RepID=A0A4R2QKU1_9PSEU|nr:acyl-CoA dehydrogenase family protein [Tamaricihabitans halophyticus]TCP50072.1 alkylation response protein AidB-like acyl-CoA dehydrogenase [Tamaricihabitans halophyticus]